ncbi:hypothetical protein JXQ70_10850 [bacterium]|nr:hypothetical protein [bacterium]
MVVAALGVSYGHIEQNLMSLLIYAMAITSVLTSYFIKANHLLYQAFETLLNMFGCTPASDPGPGPSDHQDYPIVLLGFHRGALALIENLQKTALHLLEKILVIDFNLEVLQQLRGMSIKCNFH